MAKIGDNCNVSGLIIVYADADCVVVDKPAGMPSHPLTELKGDSALEFVCESYPEIKTASDKPFEGGLVHRLDTGTSGLLVFARTHESYLKLRKAFSNNQIQKTYIALIEGQLEQDCVINYPIAHHPKNKAKMVAITPKNKYFRGKPQAASTRVSIVPPLQKGGRGDFTLIALEIHGGRRHQIRVHLAAIGHPLVGDSLYGAQPIIWRAGHALHADSISLPGGQEVHATKTHFFMQ